MKTFKKFFNYLSSLRKIIIFESNPDFSDNTYWLFKYLLEHTDFLDRHECVWFIHDIKNLKTNVLLGKKIKCVNAADNKILTRLIRFYYNIVASIIIDCNCFVHKRRKSQFRIYLTHGMPIKVPHEYLEGIGECDLLTISAGIFKDFFSQYVDSNCIKTLGLPRNDVLIDNKADTSNYIVWMPTVRQPKDTNSVVISNGFTLGVPLINSLEELEKLNKILEKYNIKIMLRPHPSQDVSSINVTEQENIIIANDKYLQSINLDLYTLLTRSMALITDYSSVYYDYLYLNRPIALTFDDLKGYNKYTKLYYKDIEKELPGIKLYTNNDLLDFILSVINGHDYYLSEREKFKDKIELFKGKSTSAITDLILQNFH